jgi:zinc protease
MIAIKKVAGSAVFLGAAALFHASLAWSGIPIQRWTQTSGVTVYLVESQALPMVDVQIDFDAGSRRDPPEQAGLAAVMAGMTSKGVRAMASTDGSNAAGQSQDARANDALDENALSEAWADLGAAFGASAGNDRLSFSLRSLTYPELLPKAALLAARQMGEPAFPQDVWQRERERLKASIREANTRPTTVAGRAFAQAVFGTHPYGYEMTEATLARIEVADMKALHERMVLPCRAKVSIVGAVTRVQAEALVSQLFSRLSAGASGAACPALADVPEVSPLTAAVDQRIPFKSAQAQVLIGQPGYKRSDPDFFR